MKTVSLRAAGAACAGAAALAAAGSASAATGSGAAAAGSHRAIPPAGATVHPMRRVGFDAAVARAHGYRIKVDAQGRRYAVRPGGLRPDDTVTGDCGESWVEISVKGSFRSHIDTGFDVDIPAVAYTWRVNRSDPFGADSHTWGGGLAERETWDGGWDITSGGPGRERAAVDTGNASALLTDGAVCVSGGPTAQATVI